MRARGKRKEFEEFKEFEELIPTDLRSLNS
jgi:hypothetical protein